VDEYRCPIPAAVTARATWELARNYQPGLYHLGGGKKLSRWDIGQILARRWPQLEAKMTPCSIQEYQGPPRSPDVSMNCAKIQKLLSFPLPGLREWLESHPEEAF